MNKKTLTSMKSHGMCIIIWNLFMKSELNCYRILWIRFLNNDMSSLDRCSRVWARQMYTRKRSRWAPPFQLFFIFVANPWWLDWTCFLILFNELLLFLIEIFSIIRLWPFRYFISERGKMFDKLLPN